METVELNLNPRPGISAEEFEPRWLALPSWLVGVAVGVFIRVVDGSSELVLPFQFTGDAEVEAHVWCERGAGVSC